MQRTISATSLAKNLGPASSGQAAYLWLAGGIERLISDGVLTFDTRLPGERSAAQALAVSRTTVAHAYDVLRERGFAQAVQGSGTRVRIPGGLVPGGHEPLAGPTGEQPSSTASPGLDLTSASPRAVRGLHEAYRAAVDQLGSYTAGGGYYRDGVPKLRELIAQRYTDRGVATSPDQIIVTTGALAGVAAVVAGLCSSGQRALVESSGYPNTLAALRRAKLRLTPVLDGELDVSGSAYAEVAERASAHVALVMPDFHNPTGHLMGEAQRRAIASTWARHDIIGIVDETLLDTWWDEPVTVRPMAAFAPNCVSVGSASKTLWGGLRIGWIRSPRAYVGAISAARLSLDLGAPVLEQLVTAELLAVDAQHGLDGERRAELRSARDFLHDEISRRCGWSATRPAGGLSLWWKLPGADSSRIVSVASRAGLTLARGAIFAPDGRGLEGRLRTPFTASRDELVRAVDILERVATTGAA